MTSDKLKLMEGGLAGLVLAAGLGTRLRPMTSELPKPAVPVGNRPLAHFSVDRLRRFGVGPIALNTHHLASRLERELRGAPGGLTDLEFHHETTLLGTGGGIRNAASRFADEGRTVIVMNGDILFAPDLAGALEVHRAHDAKATMILRSHPDPDSLGSVAIDRVGRVERLLGLPEGRGEGLTKYMFTGVHILSPRAFADLPESGCVIRHAYRRWVDAGEVVAGFVDNSPWRDLGTPRAYLDANVELASGRLAWPGFEATSGGSLVHVSAVLGEGARLENSVVGAGAQVAQGVRLERCVLWPGSRATEPAREVVFTPESRVAVGSALGG